MLLIIWSTYCYLPHHPGCLPAAVTYLHHVLVNRVMCSHFPHQHKGFISQFNQKNQNGKSFWWGKPYSIPNGGNLQPIATKLVCNNYSGKNSLQDSEEELMYSHDKTHLNLINQLKLSFHATYIKYSRLKALILRAF